MIESSPFGLFQEVSKILKISKRIQISNGGPILLLKKQGITYVFEQPYLQVMLPF